jgi:DNA modification methylase
MASGELSKGEFIDFLTQSFKNSARFSELGSYHYQFIDFRHLDEMLAAGRQVYSELLNVVIWAKPGGGGLGAFYKSAYEMIFVWRHGRGRSRNNIQNGRFGRNRTNLWSYPSPTRFGGAGEENDLVRLHPSPKPVQLLADAILDVTKRGEIVADPFLGSGSTLIAAQRTGRICLGLELDPLHVDLVIRRWQRFTGLRARHSATGRYFDDLEAGAPRKEKRNG